MSTFPDEKSADIAGKKRNQQRAEVRRILLFVRAANRLRELTTKQRFTVEIELELARVQPPDLRQRVLSGLKTVERVDPLVIESLAIRLRPFMMAKEDCFFPYIVKTLSRHMSIENGPMTFDELSAKWKATLSDTTAPLSAGLTFPNIIPGYTAESLSEGRLHLMVDHQLLTSGEVMDLLLYGEVAHRDRDKERKLVRIRESQVGPGFELAVIAVASKLGQLVDILRMYAEAFVKQLPPEIITDIEENVP
jgi:hypothetical protein